MGVKISELTQATTTNQTDVFPIVQDSTTKKVTKEILFESVLSMIANNYSTASTYEVGDYVIYNGILYRCITQITTAEEFDNSKWEISELGSVVANANRTTTNLFNLVYPVGSIYMSINDTNPGTIFGGTWTAWGTGRVPVGIDTTDTDFSTVEKTGGSKFLQAHSHRVGVPWAQSGSAGQGYPLTQAGQNYYNYQGGSAIMENTGTGDSGNLQPYITCYMWKRTA